jgi:hypothetical protein
VGGGGGWGGGGGGGGFGGGGKVGEGSGCDGMERVRRVKVGRMVRSRGIGEKTASRLGKEKMEWRERGEWWEEDEEGRREEDWR